jgi:iron complex outermembrane receptor protein
MTTSLSVSSPPSASWLRRFIFGALASLALALTASAQSANGVIQGRVLNQATGEYVRNAEVRIPGTNLVVESGDGGFYELRNVPPGQTTVQVSYPGADAATATVQVSAGAVATRDFEVALTSAKRTGEQVVQLGAFVVETEREGQSKMVAEQKAAVNMKQVMSADNFGDMSEQNIGEFLKYLPGISIDYVETDTRAASMGGMDPKYGYITLDGNAQASGASGNAGANSRQFEFESVSMNNIESIEVNKTLTADMPADAPAGTVNLRTRSALDRKRPSGSFTAGFLWNSLDYGFDRKPRHDDGLHAKTRPRFSFDYNTGAILGGRLGITMNASFTNIYKFQYREGMTFDSTSAQAIAARAPLVTAINYKDGPKITEKSSGGIQVDYQPFPQLRIKTGLSYSYFNDFFANRNLNFVTTAANLGAGSSLTKVVALNTNNTNTRVDQSGESTGKLKDNTNLSMLATYRTGPWTIDTSALYSRARETRGALFFGTIGNTPVRLSRIGFTAERSSVTATDWHITQTSGADWYDWNNWGVFDAQDSNANYQQAKTEQWTGKIDFKRVMSWSTMPTSYKFGVGENVFFNHNWVSKSFVGRYVGPTGNALTSRMPLSKAFFDINTGFGGGIGNLPVVDKEAMYVLLRDHPEYYTQSAANLATQIDNVRGSFQSLQEDVRSAYVLQESRLGKWIGVAGVRMENTRATTIVPGEVPIINNPFATVSTSVINGKTVTIYRAATTPAYSNYRWSAPRETVWGEYTDFLPSASAKYQATKNLNFKLGFNGAIKRPDLDKTAGGLTYAINDETGDVTVTVPNPKLKPERSIRFSAMVEYYFTPAGVASLHVYESRLKNAVDSSPDGVTAEEAGFTDPEFADYRFLTYHNLDAERVIRGFELSYSQQLRFFKNPYLRATSIFANYSQRSASPRPRNATRFVPRDAAFGVTWNYNKYFFQVNGKWTDETFTGSNSVPTNSIVTPGQPEYLRPRTILFVSARYKMSKQLSLFVSGDRAYDSGKIWYYKYDGRTRQAERYGAQWSAGVRGDF